MRAVLWPHTDRPLSCLDSSYARESVEMVTEHLVLVVGKETPVPEQTAAIEAAVVARSQLVELLGRGDRKGAQHHLIDQGEDGGSGANAERESQHCRDGKARRAAKLTEGVTKILRELLDELHESSFRFGYSMRNATIGSMEAARLAGTSAATVAAIESTSSVRMLTCASNAPTPYRCCAMSRPAA